MKNPKVNKCLSMKNHPKNILTKNIKRTSRKNHPKNILTKNIKRTSRKNIKKILRNKKKSLKYQHLNINKIAFKKKIGGTYYGNFGKSAPQIEEEKKERIESIELLNQNIQQAFTKDVKVDELKSQQLKELLEKYHVAWVEHEERKIIHRILAPFHSSIDYSRELSVPIQGCVIPDFNNLDLENGFQYINELLIVINKIYKLDPSLEEQSASVLLGHNSMTPLHYIIESIAIIKHCLIEKFRDNLKKLIIEKINEAELLETYISDSKADISDSKTYYPDGNSMEKQLSRKLNKHFFRDMTSDGLLYLLKSLKPKDVLKITKEECEKLINDAQDENFKKLFWKPESSSYPRNRIEEIYKEIKDTFKWKFTILKLKKNKEGLTPLDLACRLGVYEMVEFLLFPDGTLDEEVTVEDAFYDAIFIGYPKVVETLLKHPQINVNIGIFNEYNDKTFPLILACEKGRFEVVLVLLGNSDINVNIQSYDGDTPLIVACREGYFEMVELLLEHSDIDVNIKNKYGDTPLIVACTRGNLSSVKLLLGKSNINVNIQNNREDTPLMAACRGRNRGNLAVIQLLLSQSNIDVNIKNKNEDTPLIEACRRGNLGSVKLLLDYQNINVNIENNNGDTPLIEAIRKGYTKLVELLLEHSDIDVNIQNNNGDTPLIEAFRDYLPVTVVELLLGNSNINVNIQNNNGDTPLLTACREGNYKSVGLLLNHKSGGLLLKKSDIKVNIQNVDGDTALIAACRRGNRESVKLLLKHSEIDVNTQNFDGDTPLIVACRGLHHEVVRLLLRKSNINVNIQNNNGDTPLLIACQKWIYANAEVEHHKQSVELLLKNRQIKLNIQNVKGDTPLIVACREGNYKSVGLLLNHKSGGLLLKKSDIKVNIQNLDGDTALIAACRRGNHESVELLLKDSEIDVTTQNNFGETPLFVSLEPINYFSMHVGDLKLKVFKLLMTKIEPRRNFDDYKLPLNESQKETLKLIYQTLVIEKNHGTLKSIFSKTPLTYKNMDEILSANKEELKKTLRYLYKSNIKNNVGSKYRKAPSFFILDLNVKYEEDTCFKKLKYYLTEHPDPNSVRPKIGITSYNKGSGVEKEDTFYRDFPGNESLDYGGLTKHFLKCLRENIINILQRDIKDPDCLWVLSHFKEIIRFYNRNNFDFYLHIQEFIKIFGEGIIENTLAFYLSMGNHVGVCILQAYLSNNFEIPESVKATYPDYEDSNKEKRTCQQITNQDTYSEYNTYLEDNGLNKFKQLCANLFNNTNLLTEILFFLNEHLIDYTLEDMKSLIDKIVVDDIDLDNLGKFKELLKFSSNDMNEEQQMAIYKKLFLFWTAEEYPSGNFTLKFVDGNISLNSHTCFNQLIISKNYLENFKTENLKIQELIGN